MPTLVHRWYCLLPAAIVMLIAPAGLIAQWPSYSTPGVPRTADGKANLSAPAPKTPDGKPDFTGIWENFRPPAAGQNGRAPAANGDFFAGIKSNDDFLAVAKRSPFWNLGSSFKDGLPFQPWAAELHRQRVADNSMDNPDAHCLPMGIMQFHYHGQPRKMIQTPQVIVILYEANAGIRQIFTDGRPLPTKDADPWWYGYSTGHWEGDTLVVQSAGFRDLGWLDVEGSPLSDAAHVTERFHRPDFGHLDIEVTIEDAKAYTKPFTVMVHQRIMVDTELIEFVCQENEKSASHLRGK